MMENAPPAPATEAEVRVLRAALACYADPRNWREGPGSAFVLAHQDQGWMARLTLGLPLKVDRRNEERIVAACRAIAWALES